MKRNLHMQLSQYVIFRVLQALSSQITIGGQVLWGGKLVTWVNELDDSSSNEHQRLNSSLCKTVSYIRAEFDCNKQLNIYFNKSVCRLSPLLSFILSP